MNLLYAIFIFPLRFLMNAALTTAHSVTGDAGASILILSVLVNTILLPLYYLAERWQNKERSLQRLLAPKIGEIKKHYRGEEQYNRTVELYKAHNYHPIMSLRTSFGFLIQVPFFIAAYTLLSHNPLLDGRRFLFLADLSSPDGLISAGSIAVNAMPFVMTIFNLCSSYVYAKKLSPGEKLKLAFIAILFLVLLYDSASGLVLYWTLNNLYSWIKNAIHNPVKFEGSDGEVAKGQAIPAKD